MKLGDKAMRQAWKTSRALWKFSISAAEGEASRWVLC